MKINDENYFNNKRVVITGAAGTIGSALVRYFLVNNAITCALDNNEDGLFQLGRKYDAYVDKYRLKLFLGDIRDKERLEQAFEDADIVVHAAALKHVEMSELNVFDCIATNVTGVDNVVKAALKCNVEKIVFTSSDKAVNPSSTMGATKLLGERIISAANNIKGKRKSTFSSVRFGNVLKSNGSVLTIFDKALKNNNPLPITDEKMTRFFLTIEHSIELIEYALKNMKGGEVFVKNMGSANILKLAEAFVGGKKFNHEIVGTKPGEKLYEELITEVESHRTYFLDGFFHILPEVYGSADRRNSVINSYPSSPIGKPLVSTDDDMNISEIKQLIDKV